MFHVNQNYGDIDFIRAMLHRVSASGNTPCIVSHEAKKETEVIYNAKYASCKLSTFFQIKKISQESKTGILDGGRVQITTQRCFVTQPHYGARMHIHKPRKHAITSSTKGNVQDITHAPCKPNR